MPTTCKTVHSPRNWDLQDLKINGPHPTDGTAGAYPTLLGPGGVTLFNSIALIHPAQTEPQTAARRCTVRGHCRRCRSAAPPSRLGIERVCQQNSSTGMSYLRQRFTVLLSNRPTVDPARATQGVQKPALNPPLPPPPPLRRCAAGDIGNGETWIENALNVYADEVCTSCSLLRASASACSWHASPFQRANSTFRVSVDMHDTSFLCCGWHMQFHACVCACACACGVCVCVCV